MVLIAAALVVALGQARAPADTGANVLSEPGSQVRSGPDTKVVSGPQRKIGFRGWGSRVGLSLNPDHVHFGAHLDGGNRPAFLVSLRQLLEQLLLPCGGTAGNRDHDASDVVAPTNPLFPEPQRPSRRGPARDGEMYFAPEGAHGDLAARGGRGHRNSHAGVNVVSFGQNAMSGRRTMQACRSPGGAPPLPAPPRPLRRRMAPS